MILLKGKIIIFKNSFQATGGETFEPTMEEISERANVMKVFLEASPTELYAEAEWQHNPTDGGVTKSNCEEKKVCFSPMRSCIPTMFTVRNSSCGKVMFSQVSVCPGGVCGRGHAWQERRPLQQMVRILLECILVFCENTINMLK